MWGGRAPTVKGEEASRAAAVATLTAQWKATIDAGGRVHVKEGGQSDAVATAAAFVALGKVCLSSAELAQRQLPVFMTALTSHEAAAVRCNALVVLFDLAKRRARVF